jgi:hypothetical protein
MSRLKLGTNKENIGPMSRLKLGTNSWTSYA